jgi:hypothetical protein
MKLLKSTTRYKSERNLHDKIIEVEETSIHGGEKRSPPWMVRTVLGEVSVNIFSVTYLDYQNH